MGLTSEDLRLLAQKPSSLSDKQITELLSRKEEIRSDLYNLFYSFPESLEQQKRYRDKKEKLGKLSIDELVTKKNEIDRRRLEMLKGDPDDINLPDSFFGSPPIDSDEHIVCELLEERQKTTR